MNADLFIVAALVLASAAFLVSRLRRRPKSQSGCHGSCACAQKKSPLRVPDR